MGTEAQLLKTKYTIPGSNKQLIQRPLLNERLAEALSHKLTLITAPAGYGKTVTVLKWLRELSLPSAWLSADTDNNDPHLFWRYFCAALDCISDGVGIATDYVFASPELFKANMHINILIDRLSDIKQPFIFVLDDLHLITNQEILDSLSYFIPYLPSNMHFIIISRTEPRMKLSKLVLKEELIRLGVKELRFNTAEIEAYFKARGYLLQDENIRRIESYTEGWAAALVAVALSLKDEVQRSRVLNSFENCTTHIESYLADEAMNTWTEEHWRLMEAASVCDKLCGPLCEALDGPEGGRLLTELYEQNSFLIALDEEHIWFRFHHLFQEFLRKRLKKKNASKIQGLHRRAGAWFMKNDFYEEAIEHFLQGVHYEAAMALMEKLFFAMIFQGAYSKGISWLGRVPGSYKESSSTATLFEAYYYASVENFPKALELVQKVERFAEMSAPVSDALLLQCILAKINIFYRQGDTTSLLRLLENLPSYVPIDKTINYVDFNPYDITCYRTQLQIFIKLLKESPSDFDLLTGNFCALFRTVAGYKSLIIGEFNYESGKPEEALPQMAAAIDEAVRTGCLGVLVPAMVTLAKVKRSQGDFQGAADTIEECEGWVESFHKPHWSYLLKAFKIRLYLDMGNTEMAYNWIKESRLSVFQEITAAREYELIVLARVYISKQRYNDANLLLLRLLSFAEAKKRVHSVAEISILLAVVSIQNSNEDAAVSFFEKALSIGLEEGYMSSFTDELAPMVSLLELYIGSHKQSGKLAAYAKKLLIAARGNLRHYQLSPDSGWVEKLTPMEQRVLLLITDTLSNQEIADKLGVTISTAKAHSGSIYKKLGVKNRSQCIKKAAQLFKV